MSNGVTTQNLSKKYESGKKFEKHGKWEKPFFGDGQN